MHAAMASWLEMLIGSPKTNFIYLLVCLFAFNLYCFLVQVWPTDARDRARGRECSGEAYKCSVCRTVQHGGGSAAVLSRRRTLGSWLQGCLLQSHPPTHRGATPPYNREPTALKGSQGSL